ncbi:site-specific integrase [Chroococcidiopsis sp. CCMEE 29]|uniref:site-specific integrase n=1 Tax=Chroococcidiopsis sp. CCMEE 29 TaxID=155894 RepID=UPI002021C3F2|nr:site-specific integrase [Chroococcidiopsis sp. CCMEE 29]
MAKSSKGTISLESVKGRLRLRFRVNKKQYTLGLELRDNRDCRTKAALIARKIELDILANTFDPSLQKYRDNQPQSKTTTELFYSFLEWKSKAVYSRTLEKYTVLARKLEFSGIGTKQAHSVNATDAEQFIQSLGKTLSLKTLKERVFMLKACWNWAKLPKNPWMDISIKVPPTQAPKPFTKDEVQRILAGFKRDYPHYYPYVLFLFSTGVRTSEAIGLRWGSICDDSIWIGESLSKGVRKTTKNNRDRYIPLSPQLRTILTQFTDPDPCALVFTTPHGCAIDEDNFCNRYWIPTLKSANIPYRRPYNCRHTFVSHCLQSGLSPVEVASLSGHRLECLYQHYAGIISSPSIPPFF